ncbi:MAG: hypothetical protein LH613_10690 [Chamaesiphon sp.]|nr:hypothetical protein [Chamaesiphon sp.]
MGYFCRSAVSQDTIAQAWRSIPINYKAVSYLDKLRYIIPAPLGTHRFSVTGHAANFRGN